MDLTVACVLRSGGIYSPDWVAGLKRNVAAHAPRHRFVCLTDMAVPCEAIPLIHDWQGWWSKIELFRSGLFEGRVLFLDLDVLVTGAVEPLIAGTGFRIVDDWWLPGWNSSVMAWDAGDTEIYDRFSPDVMRRLRGDQDWITEIKPTAVPFEPGLVVSFKAHCRSIGKLPRDARVVVCHGRPKPPEIADGWFRTRWLSR